MRRANGVWLTAMLGLLLAGCAQPSEEADTAEPVAAEPQATAVTAEAIIESKNDSGVTGTARFTAENGQVTLHLEIAGAAPGEHAFHLHEIGDCSAADGKSAGGHWNPTAADHGKWGADPYHYGDVGNILVAEDGSGMYHLVTDVWTIGTGEDNDVVGRAVIVPEGVDDFVTQPTGAAGSRVGCGVIR